MTSRVPGRDEIDRLVAYLPLLYAPEFKAVERWEGGKPDANGVWRMPWPEYHPLVNEFFWRVAADGWMERGYSQEAAWRMLKDEGEVARASLEQIMVMLTFCVRGERFADGHWAEMIENGHIRRILTRLQQLRAEGDEQADGRPSERGNE